MKLSIIISAYNVENYIDRCMKSLMEQTRKDFEIVLINDGSKDGTDEKCREWASRDPRIKYTNNPHLGVGESKNTGIRKASGDYITIVDADDWVDSNYVETLMGLAEEKSADVVIADMYFVTNNSGEETRKLSEVRLPEGLIDKTNTLFFISKCRTFFCGKVIRKCLFEENNLWLPGHSFEDISVCPFLMAKAQDVVRTGKTHYSYLRNRNTSIINDYEKLKYTKIALEELWKRFEDAGLTREYSQELSYLFWGQVCHLWHMTDTTEGKFSTHDVVESKKLQDEILDLYKKLFNHFHIIDKKLYAEKNIIIKRALLNLCLTKSSIVDDVQSADVIFVDSNQKFKYPENKKVISIDNNLIKDDETSIWNLTDIIFATLLGSCLS